MAKGKVKWFNAQKGYGFITQDSGPDLFVHHTQIKADGYRSLDQGQAVEFEVGNDEKGPSAMNVVKI